MWVGRMVQLGKEFFVRFDNLRFFFEIYIVEGGINFLKFFFGFYTCVVLYIIRIKIV